MKLKYLLLKVPCIFALFIFMQAKAQVPVAAFSISPNPVCSGSANVVQITDLSTGSPTSWSYTMQGTPPPPISTLQNPSVYYNAPGVYTIILVATNGSGASLPVSHTIQVLQSPAAIINPQSFTTCSTGNPVNLSVLSGGPGGATNTYSWSNGAPTSTVAVNPSVTTTYSCTITSTNGCSVVRTATVVISQPTITLQSNPVSICPGFSVNMVANSSGPTPQTFSWSNGATTKTISTNVAGVYSVTVTDANGCTGTQSYTLTSSPTLSLTTFATPTVICIGSNVQLHVTGGNTYTWSTGSNNPNPFVTPTVTTVYSVTASSGTCTGTSTLSVPVAVNPTLSVSSSTGSICQGALVTLSASGADTYTWNPGAIFTSTASVSPSVSTTYTLRGVNVGCPAKNATVAVNVLPAPAISVSSSSALICAGENVALAASGAPTFTWSTGAGNSVLILNPTVTTTYSVTGTGTNGCQGMATITQSVSDCVGIMGMAAQVMVINIYPNPATTSVFISSPQAITLFIFDATGRQVRETSLNVGEVFSVKGLNAGIYSVAAAGQGIYEQKKLIILGE